jgi:transcriptional regulator with XRE-family HTH domain
MSHNPAQHSNTPDGNIASRSPLKRRKQLCCFRIRYEHFDGSPGYSFDPPPDEEPRESFGALIKEARKSLHLRLADVAPQIFKRNGQPISVPYLNDLEQNRSAPPRWLIPQLADVLNIPEDILYFALDCLPPDIYQPKLPPERILRAFQVFRAALEAEDKSPM